MLNQSGPLHLSGRIHEVLEERGLTPKDLVTGLGERHVGTGYRLLAGQTSDPWISTVLEVCHALAIDPDELLEVSRAPLDPESEALLDQKHSTKDYRVVKEVAILPFSALAILILVMVGSRRGSVRRGEVYGRSVTTMQTSPGLLIASNAV